MSEPRFIPERTWTITSTTYRLQNPQVVEPCRRKNNSDDPMIVHLVQIDRVDDRIQAIRMRGYNLLGDGSKGSVQQEEVFYLSVPNSPAHYRLPKWAKPLLGSG